MRLDPNSLGANKTPPLGLALGGGVARGWAHIGALRALIEAGIKPDIIAGTSIGAVVGGAYLAGKLDVLENWALALNKRRMMSYMDVRWGGSGFLRGERLARVHAALPPGTRALTGVIFFDECNRDEKGGVDPGSSSVTGVIGSSWAVGARP